MTPLLLGIDLGTSGVKALLIDADGRIVAASTVAHPLSSPRPLWSEQRPEDWWDATVQAIRAVLDGSEADPGSIACVGLTGQMHGLTALDAHGVPVRPCILWNDQRCQDECDEIERRIGRDELLTVTGKPVLPSFTAPKLLWTRRHEPEVYGRIAHVLLPKDYIRYRLTGALFGEVTDASGTSLFDIRTREWSLDLRDALDIPAAWLPEVTESQEVSAWVSVDGARETGLRNGTPVVGGAGDQAAEAVGCGILAGGVSATIGTSGVIFAGLPACTPDPEGRVHTYCHAIPGVWHVMGVTLSAGGSLRWFRDTFCDTERTEARARGRDPYDVMLEHAASVPAGADGLFFLPYLTGERSPHPDPYARGAFIGFTPRHTRAHAIRAVVEGVSFALRDSLELVRTLGITPEAVRISGGGARNPIWRALLADVFGCPVETVNVAEGAAFGAALLAGVGARMFDTVQDAAQRIVRATHVHDPGADREAYAAAYQEFRALYPALRGHFGMHAGGAGGGGT